MPECRRNWLRKANILSTFSPRKKDDQLKTAVSIIKSGGVVALPFERLFGLAANALNAKAVERAALAKGRDTGTPISVIIPDMEHLDLIVADVPAVAKKLTDRFWPGPLTLLMTAKSSVPARLVSSKGLIGVRLPGSSPAFSLAVASGCILTATSANKTGAPDALTHKDIEKLSGVDMVVPGRVQGPPGSTIVDIMSATPTVLRQGIVNISEALREVSNEY